MPTVTKKSRPRIKIEETTDEPVLDTANVTEENVEEIKEVEKEKETEVAPTEDKNADSKVDDPKESDKQLPSITSFSQLDVPPIIHPDAVKQEHSHEHEVQVENTDNKPVDDTQIDTDLAKTDDKSDGLQDTKPTIQNSNNLSSEEVKEWLKDVRPDTTKELSKGGGSGFSWGKVFFVAIIVVALGALAGGVYYYQSTTSGQSSTVAMTPTPTMSPMGETPTPEVTVTPTPEEKFDVSTLTISILNGSGIAGEAGRANALLEKAGFKKATTANAASFDFTDTEVRMKSTVPDSVFETIKTSLEVNYKSVVKVTRAISDKEKNDIEITLGEKK